MNNTAIFPVAAGTPAGNQTATTGLTLTVMSGTTQIFGQSFPGTAVSISASLPVGGPYVAKLVASDSNGAVDSNPPSVSFSVPAPPAPPAPPDPTLGEPTFA